MTDPVTATLVDSNVLLDLFSEDPTWYEWSAGAIATAADLGPLVINQMVYAEISARFSTIELLDAALAGPGIIARAPVPWAAAFLAAKCHGEYRRRGGARTTTLPDFFIGAHAAVLGLRLLTRDAARYRSYFPTVEVIAPEHTD